METKTAQGFTLIELLITLAVMAILGLMALPMYSSFEEKRRVSDAAENLHQILRYAESETTKRSSDNVWVEFADTESGTTWTSGPANNWSVFVTDVVSGVTVELKRITSNAFPGVSMNQNFTGDKTAFDYVRRTAKTAGTVTLTIGSDYVVEGRVSTLGRIKICYEKDGNALRQYPECPD